MYYSRPVGHEAGADERENHGKNPYYVQDGPKNCRCVSNQLS